MSKKTIAVIFGGQSSEHEVSCVSATTIISNINKELYDIILIGITKDGKWLKVKSIEDIESGEWKKSKINAVISPDATTKGLLIIDGAKVNFEKIDLVFPALHGKYGEDGTIQGLLELAKIPYVGSGVLSSALAMDKAYSKLIGDSLGIKQAEYVLIRTIDMSDMESCIKKVEDKLNYPVFVKPSNAGSSQGVSKANNRDELTEGIKYASEHDNKILVEETIVGRELECAVLGGSQPKASGIGEILAAADFYDYDAKYNNEESKTIINPQLPAGVDKEIREKAIKMFNAIDGYGLARVDFFLKTDTNEVIFNEINTLPGFTAISMYPMLWESRGIGKSQLIEKLIQSAFARAEL